MSNIKINDVPQRIQYAATNGQTQFSIPFPFFQNSFIVVWQDGVQIFQGAAPGQYLISGAGSPSGGLITLVTPAIMDSIITIQGEMPIDRTSIYSATISNLTGSDLNGDFNREVVMLQQLNTTQQFLQLQYAPWALVSQDPTVTRDRYLPILAPQQVFRMNEAGTGFEGYTLDNSPAPSTSPYVTYTVDDTLENPQNLGLLGDGILKQTVSAGVATLAIAIPGVDYLDPSMPLGTMAYQNANDVNITGGVGIFTSGQVLNSPILPSDLVNKAYADSIAAGFTFKAAANVATTGALNTTYNNGVSGVGATLTSNVNGVLSVDSTSPAASSRVVVKDQSNSAQNGIYVVTDAGSVGTPFILTRATDFDNSAEIVPGSIVFIQDGATYAETSFVETNPVVTVGTDPIIFVQFSQQYPLSMGNGGTGSAITPINNGVFSTNGSAVGQLSATLPSGLTIPGYAHSGANADITSMTGLTGKIQAPTAIASSAGLNVLGFSYTASAVNYLNITNAATAGIPIIDALGTDTDIGIAYRTKGVGGHNFYSESNTPLGMASGTGFQHITIFNTANTSATRNVTFPDASGTLAFTSDLDWELITTTSASGSSPVESFINLAGYRQICIVYSNMTPSTNAAQIGMLASINNGSSYLTAAGSYFWQVLSANNTTISGGTSTTATFMQLSSNISNLASAGMFGMIWLNNMTSTTNRKHWISKCCHFNSATATLMSYDSVGEIITSSAVNALEFATTGGNIATGEFAVYGIR